MDVRGNVTFDGNTAVFGAGVAMSGRSLVNQNSCTSIVTFYFSPSYCVPDTAL